MERIKFEGTTNYIKNISKEEMDKYFLFFEKRAKKTINSTSKLYIKYLTLGNITIKIENYVPELIEPIETQLGYCLNDQADTYDKVFYILKDDIKSHVVDFAQDADKLYFIPKHSEKSMIAFNLKENEARAYNPETQTHYFVFHDYSIDIVRKMGHLFVRELYELAKTETQHLVHAAAVGINDFGVLLCARGGGGKSTLAISALLDGFQYVSDDYSIVSRTAEGVYAYPVYSTINLYPLMQEKMPRLQAEIMYPSWWQPGKNTMSIHAHHGSFVNKLPIKAVVFPKIADVELPSIEPMDKGKAIVQMIHSTLLQLDNVNNPDNVKKLISLVSDLDFYQINLSPDLEANVKLLKQFIKERNKLCTK
jgi:hypothetical protein